MSNHSNGNFQIVTVQTVKTAATAAGVMAMVLKAAEKGTIAFVVDQKRIDILREKLTESEKFLNQHPGNASGDRLTGDL